MDTGRANHPLFLTSTQHLGAPNVIGLARLYCYRGQQFQLVEVPPDQATQQRKRLSRDGWVVVHTEMV